MTCFFYVYMNSDFTLINTVKHSNVLESLFYKFCGFWGNQDGSFILWIFILFLYGFLWIIFLQKSKWFFFFKTFFIHICCIFTFMTFILFTTNPWLKHGFFFKNGLQLNPLLQDPILSIHPPFLYAGYLGFSILFALCFISLKEMWMVKHGSYWITYFNVITWATLTIGIALGSWWAYYELGWGGWWFWDPVENMSLIPWLSSTILIHSLLLNKKTYTYDHGTISFICVTHVFTWWSTYVIRSGSLISVHAFAQNPFTSWILWIYTWILICYLYGFINKNFFHMYHFFKFIPYSKENFIHIMIYLLSGVAIIVFLSFHFPYVMDLCFHKSLSLSANFYNELFMPLTVPFFICIIFAYVSPWNKSFQWHHFPLHMFIMIFMSTIFLYLTYMKQMNTWFQLLFILIFIYFLYHSYHVYKHINTFNAMYIAHFATILLAFAIIMAPYHGFHFLYMIYPGDHIKFEHMYELIFRNIHMYGMDHYNIWFFDFFIKSFQKLEFMVFPEHRYYILNGTWTMKPHVYTNLFSDLYMTLGKGDLEVGWYLKMILNPFMGILWIIPFFFIYAAYKMIYVFKKQIMVKNFYHI